MSKIEAFMNFLDMQKSPVNWFDLLVVVTLLLGIRKGRMNGMSVELVPMIQWVAIIAGGALLYEPLGNWLAEVSPMGHLFCYITMYVAIALVIKTIFAMIKKGAGGKLIGSDIFGRAEFYFGMFAGAVRFACILVAVLALLNAPYYSSQEIASQKAFQVDMYGSTFFPQFSAVQIQIFKDSFLGGLLKKKAEFMLITSTKAEPAKGIQRRKDELP